MAGGVGDVAGSLPPALTALGLDVRVLMPAYAFPDPEGLGVTPCFDFLFACDQREIQVRVFESGWRNTHYFFLQAPPYFGEDDAIYTYGNCDHFRYLLFNMLVKSFLGEYRVRSGWFPDLIHLNDWPTAPLPYLLSADSPVWGNRAPPCLLTIHNGEYQGAGAGAAFEEAGLEPPQHTQLANSSLRHNFLAIGMVYARGLNTVSPNYAHELAQPESSHGLHPLIRPGQEQFTGILNGLDPQIWNPKTSSVIRSCFDFKSFKRARADNKKRVQSMLGLPGKATVPLLGMVTRLVHQKGIDLVIQNLTPFLKSGQVQLLVLGKGEPQLEKAMAHLSRRFPRWVAVELAFDHDLAEIIYAGCDVFLMPSRREPCGIAQMIAMSFGALPLVRKTGGLADTVTDWRTNPDVGTGFVFDRPNQFQDTLRWALNQYHQAREAWRQAQIRAMTRNFGWSQGALQYRDLYEQTLKSV